MSENLSGLSAREVEERKACGEGGTGAAKITKTKPQIVRENLCTLFNFLNFLIAVLLFFGGGIFEYAVHRDYYSEYCDWDCAGVQGEEACGRAVDSEPSDCACAQG